MVALLALLASTLPPQEPLTADDWDRIALEQGAAGNTDAEMRAWLEALRLEDGDRRRRELGRLAAPRARVRVTVRHETGRKELDGLALTLDGGLLATSAEELRVWGGHTARLLWTADGEGSPSFSADARWIASCSGTEVVVRHAREGEEAWSFEAGGTDPLLDVHLGPKGRTVLVVSETDVAVHDVASGRAVAGPMAGWAYGVVFDREGERLAAAFLGEQERDWGVLLWERGEGLRVLPYQARCAAFDPSGTHLAVLDEGDEVRLLDLATGELEEGAFPVAALLPRSMVLDGSGLLGCAGYGLAWRWDVASGRPAFSPRWYDGLDDDQREKYGDFPMPLAPDGDRHALGGVADTLRIWSVETGAPVGPPLLHGERVDLAVFAGDSRVVACASRSGLVRVWQVPAAGTPAPPPPATRASVRRVEGGVSVRTEHTAVHLLDLPGGRKDRWGPRPPGRHRRLAEVDGSWADPRFDTSGERVVVASGNGEVTVLDLEGRRVAGPFRNTHPGSAALAGNLLTHVDWFQATTWDLDSGRPVGLEGLRGEERLLPSGVLATAEGPVASTIDVVEGTERSYRTSAGTILDVGPAGERVLVEEDDQLVLRELASGHELARRDRGSWVPSFSVDGEAVLLWNEDRVLTWRAGRPDVARPLPEEGSSPERFHLHGVLDLMVAVGEEKVFVSEGGGPWRAHSPPAECSEPVLDPTGRRLLWAAPSPRETLLELALATPAPGTVPEPAADDVDGRYLHGLPVAASAEGSLAWMDGPRRTVHRMWVGGRTEDVYFSGAEQDGVRDLAWSDGDVLGILGESGDLRLDGQTVRLRATPDLLAIHPDGRRCAFAAGTRVWVGRPSSSAYEASLVLDAEADLGGAPITALGFRRDGARLAVGTSSNLLHWLDAGDLTPARGPTRVEGKVLAVAHAGEDDAWLVGGETGVIRVGEEERTWELGAPVLALARTAFGWIAAGADGRWHAWTAEHDELDSFPIVDDRGRDPPPGRANVDEALGRVACAFRDGSVAVWSLEDGEHLGPPFAVDGEVLDLRFDATGDTLLVITEYGATAWGVASGTRTGPPLSTQHGSGVVLPGEPLLWAGTQRGRFRVLRVEDGAELWSVGHRSGLLDWGRVSVALHPDGEHLLLRSRVHVHLLRVVDRERVEVVGTRRRPLTGRQTLEFLEGLRVLDGVDAAARPPVPRILDFASPGAVRLEGGPRALIEEWEPRLGWSVSGGRLVRRSRPR